MNWKIRKSLTICFELHYVWVRVLVALSLVLNCHARVAASQEDEMELMNQVSRLEAKLNDPLIEKRDEAEAELVKVGPAALKWISSLNDNMSTDQRTRIRRVRGALEAIAAKATSQPSKFSLLGEKKLPEILAELKRQTGNNVKLPEGAETDTLLQCHWENALFWEVVHDILTESKLTIDPYSGDGINLVIIPSPDQIFDPNSDVAEERFAPLYSTAGVVSMHVNRIDNSINLGAPSASYTSMELSVNWEPRLKPINIDMPLSEISYTDDRGTVYDNKNDQVISALIQPELNGAEFTLNLPLIDRKASEIASLDGIMHLLVPGRLERFEFKDIDTAQEGTWQEKADAKVTYGGISKNEDLFGMKISLSFATENNAMESHYGWVMQNRVFLKKADGEEVEPIGFETFQQSENEVGLMYLFVEIPAGATLCYETPAAIVKMELPFSLKRIPLP